MNTTTNSQRFTNDRERCWIAHRRNEYWTLCPLCNAPLKWVRLFDGKYSPCDEEPILYSFPENGQKSKIKVVVRGELVENIIPHAKNGEKPRYGRLPHYFSCPVLRKERQEWARKNKGW